MSIPKQNVGSLCWGTDREEGEAGHEGAQVPEVSTPVEREDVVVPCEERANEKHIDKQPVLVVVRFRLGGVVTARHAWKHGLGHSASASSTSAFEMK